MSPRDRFRLCWRHIRKLVTGRESLRTAPPRMLLTDEPTARMMHTARTCWWDRGESDDTAKARTRITRGERPRQVYGGRRQRELFSRLP